MHKLRLQVKHAARFVLFMAFLSCSPQEPAETSRPFFFDFESDAELHALKWECHHLLELDTAHATHGASSLKLTMSPHSAYPGLKIVDFDLDWSQRRALQFDIFNPQDDTLRLNIEVHDRDYSAVPLDYFDADLMIPAGASRHALSFARLVTRDGRRLDLTSIEKVYLLLPQIASQTALYFDHLRLE